MASEKDSSNVEDTLRERATKSFVLEPFDAGDCNGGEASKPSWAIIFACFNFVHLCGGAGLRRHPVLVPSSLTAILTM